MQYALDYGQGDDLDSLMIALSQHFGTPGDDYLTWPIDQLVRSLIASRTLDRASDAAFVNLLIASQGDWNTLADAPVDRIEHLIRAVNHPDKKAVQLKATLLNIRAVAPDFNLAFLGPLPEIEAQAWLMNHAGIGPKVAAAILNFSELDRRSFVADTHVLRVFVRYGLIGRPDAGVANTVVTGATADWTTRDLRLLHGWVKKLGQTLCTHFIAHCAACPIAGRCRKIGAPQS